MSPIPSGSRSACKHAAHEPARRALRAIACVGASAFAGCHAPPMADVDPEQAIADLALLPAPVSFRLVGPEGGPIDEPDRSGPELTQVDAVRRALSTDPGLQAALARVRMALADAEQARLLPNPVLDFVIRWGSGAPQIETALLQPFVEVLQRPRRAGAADDRLRAVAAESIAVALDVIAELQASYVAAQASASLRPLLQERLALAERLVATARARLDAGEGSRADLVTLDAQRVEISVTIDRTHLQERTNRLHLARLIGEPSSEAGWTLDSWSAHEISAAPESAWVEAALRARPEVQAVVWQLEALGDDEALARYVQWEGASLGVDAQRDGSWRSGPILSAPLPIFDPGDARRARITAQILEARHALTLARRTVVEEVRTAWQLLAANRANLERVRRELVPLLLQRRKIAEDSYRAGQTDVTPLFLSEQDLRIAQTQVIELEAQAAVALVRLQRAVGGPGVAAEVAGRAPVSDASSELLPAPAPNREP